VDEHASVGAADAAGAAGRVESIVGSTRRLGGVTGIGVGIGVGMG